MLHASATVGVLPFLLVALCIPGQSWGKIKITHLSVPDLVRNGSESSVLLDCEFEYDSSYDDKLTIRWFLNNGRKAIYQWLPKVNESRSWSDEIGPYLDKEFEVDDPNTRYRALHLRKPRIELSGKYTCTVSSIDNSDSASAYMLIYAPANRMEFSYRKTSSNSLMLTCQAEEIFPEPTIKIYKVDDSSDTSESDSTKSKDKTTSTKETTSEETNEETKSSESDMTETDSESTVENPSKDSNISESTESESRVSRKGRKSTSKTSESDNTSESKTGSKSTSETQSGDTKSKTSESDTESKETNSDTDSKNTKTESNSTESETNETVNDPDESEETSESKDTSSKTKSTDESNGKDSSCDESDEVPNVKVTNILGKNGFTAKIVSEFKLKKDDDESEFECSVEIPNTGQVQKQRLHYKPESSSSSSSEVQDAKSNPDMEKRQAATPMPDKAANLKNLSYQLIIVCFAFLITW